MYEVLDKDTTKTEALPYFSMPKPSYALKKIQQTCIFQITNKIRMDKG